MQSATVFNIQKFSLNDGPGIRTVVFFKGCPLHCFWCSNPESQRKEVQLEWKASACIACGRCVAGCPEAGVSLKTGKRHVNIKRVDGTSDVAQQLVENCPARALTLVGERKTSEEVLKLCLQDKPFYEDSGGGVTLSGGEAMLWPEFVLELLAKLHADDIDCCIETEAFVAPHIFAEIANHLDHLLIDFKHADPTLHQQGTGVSNELPLANIRWAVEAGKDVLVRTPVIPQFNCKLEHAEHMAQTLAALGVERVQLLPFHNFGEQKYELLERDYQLAGHKNLSAEDLAAYAQAYERWGVHAFF